MTRQDSYLPLAEDFEPTLSELQGSNIYAATAKSNWLREDANTRFSTSVVREIYNALEQESFNQRSLLLLETLQYVERYLWPNYNEDSPDELVISLVMMVAVKRRETIYVWGIWQNLHSEEAKEIKLEGNPLFKKAWRGAVKKFSIADQKAQARLKFERSWLHMLVLDFISTLFNTRNNDIYNATELLLYAGRMVEFLTDLLSQLPTRRYVHELLEDLQILPCLRLSSMFTSQSNVIFRDLVALFEHYYYFDIDAATDLNETNAISNSKYRKNITKLQRESIQVSRNKLTVLGLTNYASISKKEDLEHQISSLDDKELAELYQRLSFRKSYPQGVSQSVNRQFMLCTIVEAFSWRPGPAEIVKSASVFPNEESLFNGPLPNNSYNGLHPIPVPKLNIQYLSPTDFLWRIFSLYKAESFHEIRRDLQDSLKKLRPKFHNGSTIFTGVTKMALQINKISILEVAPPRVGESYPFYVHAELDLCLDKMSADTRKEWESLRSDDVVFLLSAHAKDDANRAHMRASSTFENIEVQFLRCAEILQVFGEDKQAPNPSRAHGNKKLHVRLDRKTYMNDVQNNEDPSDVYGSLNVLIRRKGVGNNFKSILSSIQSLIQETATPIPGWFRDTFLGCGDPTEACFPNIRPVPETIDFGETFHNIEHLQETLISICQLNINIHASSSDISSPFTFKKVRVDHQSRTPEEEDGSKSSYEVYSSKPTSKWLEKSKSGPLRNAIRYTGAQVKAIFSGTNTGLTLVLGPPGTGKTDVATQIVSNIYHNFPNQRTLVIAHSNQALNQLFQKIVERNIDERHLLRLGYGEDDTHQFSPDSGRFGRIESLIDIRTKLLQNVEILAASVGAPGAHGNSCETASYFNQVYIKPLWEEFKEKVVRLPTIDNILTSFPFHAYFTSTEQAPLQARASFQLTLDAAEHSFDQISKIFMQLNDLMPFEILRNGRDKTNYLLVKTARIIAMTSTYAAIKREDIIRQGFQYDNVVMEEAAQMTEIEAFIPLTLQNPINSNTQLKRIILCGDHLQNPSVIQNSALRYFSNMEQSLFARFVRLGVPQVILDKQGRARPSIASLYSWRYSNLGDLSYLHEKTEFLRANAGFRHEFQFIDVGDFRGHGEQEPSPYFIQNLGEAEYAVALFQYMRLLGYPASKISILASYTGQRALIRDIINHRCAKNQLFGSPAHITTIDKFQGEQNDYVIVSLVRTNRVGYLRDLRRLTVALSRARLGLYLIGRLKIFQTCYELKDAFSRILRKPTKLELITGEMWPTERLLEASAEYTVMEGVEHLGE
ncbi:hypothetical protein H072_9940 [Dactylellina haptotyla CBS 200.50]|uniref:Pre-mRNA-splicing factor n=1 Tax=Dactylellina haptotyla (strain CBS 200.50) TaxID=1284197 RepID=S8A1D0_DACHA|nr:hypothetical protein H072_9940 [Dactylellina haptotyla CBS 200.50]